MSRMSGWKFNALVGVGAFLALSLYTAPTTSSIPENRPLPPSVREVVILDELREWVDGVTGGVELRPLDPSEIGDEIRRRPESFTLFRDYLPQRERRRLLRRMPHGHLIVKSAKRYELDGLLIAAVVEAESGFDPYAVSVDGALGLMQVMPSTADLLGADDPLDPAVNVDVGTRYLRQLLSRFGGDLELALAAYNAGPGNVLRFGGVPPFPETQAYVDRVLDRYVAHHRTLWRDHLRRDWHVAN